MCGAVKQPINLFIVAGTETVPASHARQFFGTIPTSSGLRGIISWHSGLVSDSICLSFFPWSRRAGINRSLGVKLLMGDNIINLYSTTAAASVRFSVMRRLERSEMRLN